MSYKQIKYVKATPTTTANGSVYFASNAKPGDIVLFKKAVGLQDTSLHKPAKILSETPFHFLIDMGKFNISVCKASIYCGDEILYFLPQ